MKLTIDIKVTLGDYPLGDADPETVRKLSEALFSEWITKKFNNIDAVISVSSTIE